MEKHLSQRMNDYLRDPLNVLPPRKTWDILDYRTVELLPYLDNFEDYVESIGNRLKSGIEITDNRAFPIIKKLGLKIFKSKNSRWYLFLENLK